MLAPRLASITRRELLLGALTVTATSVACARIPERAALAPRPAVIPELDAWRNEATRILQDGLQALRTFDVFAAYRVSTAPNSGRRSAAELVWDPPTGAEWDAATRAARGLRNRADQLFQAITMTQVDASIWREQRALADIANEMGAVGDALAAYRDRLDGVAPGDAAGALHLLDTASAQWEHTAARLGLSRSEAIGCAG